MKNREVYAIVAGLALAALGAASQKAIADDNCYFKVISPLTPIPESTNLMPRTIETTLSYPVVIEKTTSNTEVLFRTTSRPVMLERTDSVKPHHLPFSFGVWP